MRSSRPTGRARSARRSQGRVAVRPALPAPRPRPRTTPAGRTRPRRSLALPDRHRGTPPARRRHQRLDPAVRRFAHRRRLIRRAGTQRQRPRTRNEHTTNIQSRGGAEDGTPMPPFATAADRDQGEKIAALAEANRVRPRRASLMRWINAQSRRPPHEKAAELILEPDTALHSILVLGLERVQQVGPAQTERMLACAGITPTCTIGALTARHRDQLPVARLGRTRPVLQPRQQRRHLHRTRPPAPLPNQVPQTDPDTLDEEVTAA